QRAWGRAFCGKSSDRVAILIPASFRLFDNRSWATAPRLRPELRPALRRGKGRTLLDGGIPFVVQALACYWICPAAQLTLYEGNASHPQLICSAKFRLSLERPAA
ncbi:MAG: hypothetical protein RBU25_20690, partial [Lentisphaeria bacterium]|nr:hypothetical protein [Lentisphaeria bacterium]